MTYVLVEDFKRGLDRRRSIDTAPAGSLWECINAHITRGGEIEKRKAFVSKYDLPAGETFGLHATGSALYTFGSVASPSVPAGVQYQRLQHPDGSTAMSKIIHTENFDGKVYAIAEFTDGEIYHYYDGSRVTTWDGIATSVSSNDQVASALATKINQEADYSASATTNVVTITAAVAGVGYTISTSADNFGSIDDQTLATNETQPNANWTAATGSLELTGGASGSVDTVTVNGVDILGSSVAFDTDLATTAQAVADQINTYNSSPEYTATASGETITISAEDTQGDTPNGYTVGATATTITTGNYVDMNGGVDEAAQVTEVTVGGTFEAADEFTVTLDGTDYKVSGASAGTAQFVKTEASKMYALASSLLYYCAINNPTQWGSGTGAGFINLANHASGSEDLIAVENYSGWLAVFARNVIQMWSVDADDTNNEKVQVLRNTGTYVPKSVLSFGDNDVFYFSDTGIRSLRARDSSNAAYVNDVGTSVDPYVQDQIEGLSEATVSAGVAVLEPIDGRYMLAIDDRVYVFSYFPGSKISAWSTYEPGFVISDFAVLGKKMYARSGDTIYLYGDDDGVTYDSSKVTVQMPFLDSGKPGHAKEIRGIDMSAVNTWDVDLLVDPDDLDRYINIGELEGNTYQGEDIGALGEAHHIAPKLTCEQPGAAKISNFALHLTGGESNE